MGIFAGRSKLYTILSVLLFFVCLSYYLMCFVCSLQMTRDFEVELSTTIGSDGISLEVSEVNTD